MIRDPAEFYDVVYSFKDYAREAARVHSLIRRYNRAPSRQLLDVGCGTGSHLAFLRYYGYTLEGVDRSAAMLAQARQRCPSIPFYEADMATFALGYQVDILTCLFSAIGHVAGPAGLAQTLATFYRHLRPGGVAIVEPWLTPATADQGNFTPLLAERPPISVARLTEHRVTGRESCITLHYLVQTPTGVQYLQETLDQWLFTPDEYSAAFRAAGFEVTYTPEGLTDRGLYIAQRPLSPD